MQTKLKVEYWKTSELVPYTGNAKEHPDWQVEQIANSIDQFGFNDPVGVWTREDGQLEIVEGHGRVLAAKELGIEKVPIVRLDHMDDDARRAYAHVHNQTTLTSGFDEEALTLELDSIPGFDWEDFGFDYKQPNFSEYAEVSEIEIPDEVESRAKRGDIWLCGEHRLMCGDSTSAEDVDALMSGEKADMLLTDPPYNVALGQHMRPSEAKALHRRQDGLVIDNDYFETDDGFIDFLVNAFKPALESLKDGCSFYIWHADNQSHNFRAACKKAGMQIRQNLVWVKNTFALGRQDYQWKHEPCLYGWKDGAPHNWYSDRKQSTVLEFNKPSRSEQHPTMKPVELFAYQMENSSKGGDIVLDIFGGSGTTMVAAEQLGRKAYVMELDPHYCDVILERWENLTGGKAVLSVREG